MKSTEIRSTGANYAIVPLIEHSELTATDILVWGALCSFARWEWDDDKKPTSGTCNPGRGALARKALCSVRTVCKALKNLEELGFIRRTQTQRGNGLGVNHYVLIPLPFGRELDSLGQNMPYIPCKKSREFNSLGNDVPYDREFNSLGRELRSLSLGQNLPTNNIQNKEQEGEQKAPAPDDLPTSQEGEYPDSMADLQEPDTPEPVDHPPVEGKNIHATLGSDTDMEGTAQPQEERLSSGDVERLFDEVWKSYPNHGKEAVARRAFRKLVPPGTSRGEAWEKYQDLIERLNEAATYWMDDGEINVQFVPQFGNFLEGNYELG